MSLRTNIADALPFSLVELDALISTAQFRYKVYQIPKRRPGQFRTIAQPAAEIKLIQRWLLSNTLKTLRVHYAARAYRAGVSIASHAGIHASHRFLLKLDFKDFFPSILATDVFRHLVEYEGFSHEEARTICLIVCWRDKRSSRLCLSIGAPTSPFLSNAILHQFDQRITEVARLYGTSYSRYADDLAFSTDHKDTLLTVKAAVDEIVEGLAYPSLVINEQKTVSVSRSAKKTLVGLVLTPTGGVSLGRDKKKRLRALVYRVTRGLLNSQELASLRGELAFAWSIEPDYVRSLVVAYGEGVFATLDLPFAKM